MNSRWLIFSTCGFSPKSQIESRGKISMKDSQRVWTNWKSYTKTKVTQVSQSLKSGIYRRLAFVLISQKIAHAHISGRQNKNKLKEKLVESSEQLVNRVPTSIYTSFVSVDFEKNMSDSCAAFRCTNRRSTTSLQFYRIPSAKRYPEQGITKWVTAKNDWLRK